MLNDEWCAEDLSASSHLDAISDGTAMIASWPWRVEARRPRVAIGSAG